MSQLNLDETSERNADDSFSVSSRILISLFVSFFSLLFCVVIDMFALIYGGIIGVIATAYAIRSLLAKKNFDYENAVRYSRIAKVWAIASLSLSVLCWFAQFI